MSSPSTRRRRRIVRGTAAFAFVMLVVGVVPIWQYADAATPPDGDGAQEQRAEVLDVTSTGRLRQSSRGSGRVAVVRLEDGTEEQVYLARRIDYPESGDTLTVYLEDGDWHTTAERSQLELAGGIGVLLVVPLLTGGYLVSERRSRLRREAQDASGPPRPAA